MFNHFVSSSLHHYRIARQSVYLEWRFRNIRTLEAQAFETQTFFLKESFRGLQDPVDVGRSERRHSSIAIETTSSLKTCLVSDSIVHSVLTFLLIACETISLVRCFLANLLILYDC